MSTGNILLRGALLWQRENHGWVICTGRWCKDFRTGECCGANEGTDEKGDREISMKNRKKQERLFVVFIGQYKKYTRIRIRKFTLFWFCFFARLGVRPPTGRNMFIVRKYI